MSIQKDESTNKMLQAFADAWNRHDVDALMSFMTNDCVYESVSGDQICGNRYEGASEVREAFSNIFMLVEDAHWGDVQHFACNNRAVSEWKFTGTLANGSLIEANGCDVFTLRRGKIAIKNSYRKSRPPIPAVNQHSENE